MSFVRLVACFGNRSMQGVPNHWLCSGQKRFRATGLLYYITP